MTDPSMIVVNCRGRRRRRVVVLSCLSSFFSSVWTFVTLLSLTALLFGQKQPDTFSYKATAFVIPTITPTIQRSMSSSSSSCRRIPRPANLVTPSASSSMTFRTPPTPHHKNSQPYKLYNSPQPFVQHEPYTVEELASQKALSQRWKKSTKQVATLGPASCTLEMIEALFLAGADMFRLNFSHGTQEEKLDLLHLIRQVEQKYSHPIAVMGDLQGPKLRVGEFANPNGEVLEVGQVFCLDLDPTPGTRHRVQLPHPEIIEAAEIGHALLVDDGKVKLVVSGKGPGVLECTVVVAGKIKDRKGVNTPDSVLQISPLTEKDRSDLAYQLQMGVDWIALSFVQTPADMDEIHTLIGQLLPPGREDVAPPAIMAKIEKPSCFEDNNLSQIIQKCNGIMVARGDLGVECPPEDVPLLQKKIIDECRQQGKPVIVATQMLESMIDNPTPTRAEASDVSTAIYDGADAIMLSAESAAGKYPIESVTMQQRIINRVESDPHYRTFLHTADFFPHQTPADALITAARQISKTIGAKAMVCFSLRGTTVLRASKTRPSVPILALCPRKETARQLALAWGVYPDLPEEGSYAHPTISDHAAFVPIPSSSSSSMPPTINGAPAAAITMEQLAQEWGDRNRDNMDDTSKMSSSSSASSYTAPLPTTSSPPPPVSVVPATMEQLAREWTARNQDQVIPVSVDMGNGSSTTTTSFSTGEGAAAAATNSADSASLAQPSGDDSEDFDLVLRNACTAAVKKGLASHVDDLLVVTAGLPFGTPGAANIIRIVPAAGPSCWDGVCRVDD